MKKLPQTETAEAGVAPPGRRRLLILLVTLALLVVLGEVAWFSAPAQEWRLSRAALAELEALAREQPGSTRVRYHLARALLREGRTEEAFRHAREGSVMDPRSAPLAALAGLAAQATGQGEEAGPLLARARELGDRSPELFAGLAETRIAGEDLGGALSLLEEAVHLHPRRADLWDRLGYIRARLLMPEAWTQAQEQATRLAPRVAAYWVGLAESWLFRSRPEEALAAARRAVSLAPESGDAWLAQAKALALTARTDAEVQQVEAAFQEAVKRPRVTSEEGVAWREWGRFRLEKGNALAAIEPLERAVELSPQEQAAAYALSRAYRASGQKARAAAVLRQWERESTRLRDLRYLRARVAADPQNELLRRALAEAMQETGPARRPGPGERSRSHQDLPSELP